MSGLAWTMNIAVALALAALTIGKWSVTKWRNRSIAGLDRMNASR